MPYSLSLVEKTQLQRAIWAALSVPFIAGVEGYVWEAIFHYVKRIPLPNPHANKRKKLLFDAVDPHNQIGWSLKAVQKSPNSSFFELVIQRADILKKRNVLGFPKLTLESSPEELGQAILKHWNNKIANDMKEQGVKYPRLAILLKSPNHQRYALLEQDFHIFTNQELIWSWTDETHTGLQARHKNESVALRWYPNQKQLFESFILSENSYRFEVDSTPLAPDIFISAISNVLPIA